MTKIEALQVLAILKAAYPASYNGMSEEEAAGTATVWAMQFNDMSAEVVLMALQKCISTNKFPPTIAEVKNKVASVHWEAYEALSANGLSADATEVYRRIYKETQDYRYTKCIEPSITQMLTQGVTGEPLRLGRGE